MFKTALRPWLVTACLVLLSLTATWAVRAATEPSTPTGAGSNPSPTPSTAYGAPTGTTGPTTAFHDSVAARYNYAFG